MRRHAAPKETPPRSSRRTDSIWGTNKIMILCGTRQLPQRVSTGARLQPVILTLAPWVIQTYSSLEPFRSTPSVGTSVETLWSEVQAQPFKTSLLYSAWSKSSGAQSFKAGPVQVKFFLGLKSVHGLKPRVPSQSKVSALNNQLCRRGPQMGCHAR
ncbi:hypothetical protein THAOC_02796 [Thalassiosira oceanica]|uniref:Uncharacterized protein n=1 Tax=Thalassiosira oceanica TaxID=159749 RepID=K0TLP1_THAOC|nr:hypothetical protein THAOC_02796 [Thalassiosira oceanica]|eukprot:EJK75481.1 hypothetical protein THAOC_02796 [Thalassiosira oceanica]